MSEHAETAKAIRAILKEKFAGTKFQVTSECFSMGNAVNIHWIDGPNEKSVDAIVEKFKYGTFNGMTDCYEYTNRKKDIPQVKFVNINREQTN